VGEIKVTDRRMFTADGRLREEFEGFDSAEPEAEPEPEAPQPEALKVAPPGAVATPHQEMAAAPPGWPGEDRGPTLELPGTPQGLGAPGFYDLVAVLAEPASLYLGDLPLPDGGSAENLEMARLHIDLVDLLRQRTVGNLSAQEHAFLEDVLYRLRVRYVQKRG
jgi:hypothetical protein